METTEIDSLFSLLDKWRLLPAYQLERRADIFFGLFLHQILEKELDGEPIIKIIPEFPIRIGTIYPNININKSFKIDYLVICENKVLFIELKTDNSSRRTKQDKYLIEAAATNIPNLIDGLLQIFKATTSKTKYTRLLKELKGAGWVIEEKQGWKNISTIKPIDIIYIQPEKKIDSNKKIISFEEVAKMLEKNQTPLSLRLATSLRQWQKNPNQV